MYLVTIFSTRCYFYRISDISDVIVSKEKEKEEEEEALLLL